MPRYFILYRGEMTRGAVWNTYHDANTEKETKDFFAKHYPFAELVKIRKGRPFTKADIQKAKHIVK